MKALIRNTLKQECDKLIKRHYEYLYELEKNVRRKSKRVGRAQPKIIRYPEYWDLDNKFNPFKTRAQNKLDLYSHTLATKVRERRYKPMPAVRHYIKKDNGADRILNVFQLPDAALSRLVYKSLLKKNINRFSGYSYAYREDKDVHDAVNNIYWDWKQKDRIYVAEFDFSSFFDNIDHGHLFRILGQYGFIYTKEEMHVIKQFLCSRCADVESYSSGMHEIRKKGIPQGTSISLFLANVACWELDRDLEEIGVRFCRYADDTVIWSSSYDKISEAYEVIHRNSGIMDVPINYEKSKGINLITREGVGEIRYKTYIDYLGYSLSMRDISIKSKHVKKIKRKLSYILYENLLKPLKNEIFNLQRLDPIDWDYIVAISQIRRYLYGGLNDEKLRQYIAGVVPRLNFRGVMSYYPVITDREQLRKLDGWLIYVVRKTLALRDNLWHENRGMRLPGPSVDWIKNVTDLESWVDDDGHVYDLRIPSFSLINQAMNIAIQRSGINAAASRRGVYY